jgi:hypothetical protein
MIKVIENDILPESLMGRLLPLNTGHKNNPTLKEELALRRLIQQSGFINKTEPALQPINKLDSSGDISPKHKYSLKNQLISTI